jgi:hypothetical protein
MLCSGCAIEFPRTFKGSPSPPDTVLSGPDTAQVRLLGLVNPLLIPALMLGHHLIAHFQNSG